MKEIPDFDIELSQAVDYILGSGLARRAFAAPPFKNYVNILTELIRSIDRLADNCHMPEFTNHAMPHVLSMVKRGSEWGESDGWLEQASPKEAACLLMAMVIHDMGMVSQDSRNLPDKERNRYIKGLSDGPGWVRRTHIIRLDKLVRSLLEEYLTEDQELSDYLAVIVGMAESHGKWPWEPGFVSNCDEIQKTGLDADRIGAFNSVLAVCDLLDEDSDRCDTLTLIRHRHGTLENRAHWIRHALTERVEGVKNHRVSVRLRKLESEGAEMEMVYRTLRNHYRLVKLYNERLAVICGEIKYLEFHPGDGIPEEGDEVSMQLAQYAKNMEFRYSLAPQLMTTFMKEARNQDGGDKEIRTRLDGIGLETVDLSPMEEFFDPAALLYPEERILWGGGSMEEKLDYAYELAEEAGINGEIEKLRHICGLVLHMVRNKGVPLEKKYWALTCLTVYETGSMDYYEVRTGHYNSLMPMTCSNSSGVSESPYQGLLDVLMCFLEPMISREKLCEYKEHLLEYDYSRLREDFATALLLKTVIGLFWFWDVESGIWQEVSEAVGQSISPGYLKDVLGEQEKRQRLQHKLIYGAEETKDQELMEADQPVLAKAWRDFYQEAWQQAVEDAPTMVSLVREDEDLFCTVQGFQNMIHPIVKWNQFPVRKDLDREENEGIYRYQRKSGEQALPRFWKMREGQIEKALAKSRIDPEAAAGKRADAIRLISLRRVEALGGWNIGEYLESVRNEARWLYDTAVYEDENGVYRGYRENLPEAVTVLIRSMASKTVSKKEKSNLIAKMRRYFPDGFEEVVRFIATNPQKSMWSYEAEWLEYLIAELDEKQTGEILRWLIRYDQYIQTQKSHYNLAEYKFLEQAAARFSGEDWEVIMPMAERIYKNYFYYQPNKTFAIKCLEYMPFSWCEKIIAAVAGWPPEKEKRQAVYEISIVLSKRKEEEINGRLHQLIDLCRREDPCEMYSRLEQLVDVDNLLELRDIDIEGIREEVEKTMERLGAADLSGYDSRLLNELNEKIINQNWRAAPEDQVLDIIDRFLGFLKSRRGKLSKFYFFSISETINRISRTGTKEERRRIGEWYIREYILNRGPVTVEDVTAEGGHWESADSPLNTFHMNLGAGMTPQRSILSVALNCITGISREYYQPCVIWGLRCVSGGQEELHYYVTLLFTFCYFKGDQVVRPAALGGLMYIRGQLEAGGAGFEGKLREVLRAWASLADLDEWFDGQRFWQMAGQDEDYRELFVKPLQNVKEQSLNPALRNQEVKYE